jgi:hypothetical protein
MVTSISFCIWAVVVLESGKICTEVGDMGPV